MNEYERNLALSFFKKKRKNSFKCSSCAVCMNVCNHHAISMKLDQYGFYRPVIDESKCNHCGECVRICPWRHQVENPFKSFDEPNVYAAILKNDEVRLKSSSGGVFPLLAEKILQQGGFVVGVSQKEGLRFEHVIISSVDQLSDLQGPKYIQTNPKYIYAEVSKLLKEGHKVLFSGTPCQIAALYAFLGKETFDNLWTIDIVCHGVPSVKVFEKHINEMNKLFDSQVMNVCFRDKSTGWNNYSLTYHFLNGEKYSECYSKSNYMKLFLSRLCQNESCYDCIYRKTPRIGDLTLGDFWGVSHYHPEMFDDKGTSFVMVNNEHGAKLYDSVESGIRHCSSSLRKAVTNNPSILYPSTPNSMRKAFFSSLEDLSLDDLIVKYCPKASLYRKLFIFFAKMLKK